MAFIKRIFRRKKNVPLACSMTLENEEGHVHTGACFLDIQPLSIVELFQSQGCVSCPPAIPNIQAATMNPNLLLLTYNVTYFDHNGWTDTFGNRIWDNRQKAYVKKWGRNNIFTPQIIVDGLADGIGANGEVPNIVSSAREMRSQMPWHIIVDTNDTDLKVDSDRPLPASPSYSPTPSSLEDPFAMHVPTSATPAYPPTNLEVFDINLIFFDPTPQTVKVGKGANKGKKILHQNLVKGIHKLGEWRGGNMDLPLPSMEMMTSMGYAGLQVVAVVQGQSGGGIVAAQRV
ncbi:DUF1223-domain-containing protein [Stipitochalara longipes BDJ]|nr:DUF1223-domain-containing protein [Stipitochalara longipes BDJ]